MKDQADGLREKIFRMNMDEESANTVRNTEVLSIVSGKGGVGKSNIAINFALQLQQMKKKVLIMDLDIGMANIDILLGESSSYSIVDMLENDMSIWSIIEQSSSGLSYIAGGSGLSSLFEMDQSKADFFYRELSSLNGQFDFILLDMGAGVTNDSFYFLLSAHRALLVTTPEPTSITDAYAMIKFLTMKNAAMPISVIVNRTSSKREGDQTFNNLNQVAEKFLKRNLAYIMSIPNDQSVGKAVRAQTPFIVHAPHAKSSTAVKKAAGIFLNNSEASEDSYETFISRLKGFLKGGKLK